MFFSAKDLYLYLQDNAWDYEYKTGRTLSFSSVRRYVKAAKEAVVRRDGYLGAEYRSECLYKWYRPWEVVPKLKEFSPPVGDYGIGVEVEMGFISQTAASTIVNLIKNWRWIAVDIEGGSHPIEATFPPVLYSKMSSKSQVFRYLKLLRDNHELVHNHSPSSSVGTHINVSKGGIQFFDEDRVDEVSCIMERFGNYPGVRGEARDKCIKYFGRVPYGGVYDQGGYLEYKLFNSTTDGKALKRYINIAVALTDLIDSDQEITEESVFAACELGYNK